MPFSRAQQALFRPLENAAWALHCRRTETDPKDKAARRVWYENVLFKSTGKRSSKDCNAHGDFEAVRAAFEDLSESGIDAQLAMIAGDLKRLRFNVAQIFPPFLKRFPSDASLAAYALGIAHQAGSQAQHLGALTRTEKIVITRSLCNQARREKQRDEKVS